MGTNTTPALGFRYPDGVEPPALDILLAHLAQDVEAVMVGTTFAPTVGANLTVYSAQGHKRGKTATLSLRYDRQSGTVTSGDVIGALPAGTYPLIELQVGASAYNGDYRPATVRLMADGIITAQLGGLAGVVSIAFTVGYQVA